ncbi:MAG: flagellar hook assembly protein FlgD [Bacillota bacterium]
MISLQQIQAQQASQSSESSDSKPDKLESDQMGKDEFLDLLVTQLKNQDPLEPMDNKQFISQMAQFSSLEQMNNMNSSMNDFLEFQKISQAGSLVGKKVEILDSDTGQNTIGLIEKANVKEDSATVTVNGKQHSISNIQEILAEG